MTAQPAASQPADDQVPEAQPAAKSTSKISISLKTPRRRGAGVLMAAFAAVAAIAISGGAARIYSDAQQSGSLATAYAQAAACDQAQQSRQSCTQDELVAKQKIVANNDIRRVGNDALAVAGIVTVFALI